MRKVVGLKADQKNLRVANLPEVSLLNPHPVDVLVEQGCTCCNAQMDDLNLNINNNIP